MFLTQVQINGQVQETFLKNKDHADAVVLNDRVYVVASEKEAQAVIPTKSSPPT